MSSTEIRLMTALQSVARGPLPRVASAYSLWGEHAAGWIGLGVVGAAVDRPRRDTWASVAAGAFVAHGAAVVLKRVVRRQRPLDAGLLVLARTPSTLSFPSAHVSSTTAAAVALAPLVGAPAAVLTAGGMAGARVILGVHYPSDVLAGAAIGLAGGTVARRVLGRRA